MTQKDAIKTLYPVYSKNTAKPVTEEEFRNRIADPQKRKVLYNGFSNLGYVDRLGTYEQFEKWLDESQQNPANVPIQELERPGITDTQPISTDAQAQSYAQQTPPTATGEKTQAILRTGIAQALKQHDEKQDALLQTKEEGLQLQQMYDLFSKENEDAIFLAKIKRATAGVPGMVMPGSAYTEQEADVINQRNTLQSALELNKKTQKILAAPSRFDDSNAFANFGKGAASKATDIDFWTFGITNIAKNLNTRDVAMKLQKAQDEYGEDVDIDAVLTGPEKALMGAFFNNLHASALRADDLSLGYQAGQQAMESAKYMAEFILTGGISKAATKGATKALETWIIKNVASKAGRTLAKGGLAVAKGLAATAARTPVMLSTYSNITDKAVEYDENGRLINGYKAIVLGFADSFIGNLAETMGPHIIATIKLPFTSLISQIPEIGVTKFFQNLSKTGAYKLMKQGGWNGLAAEWFEEWYDNSTRALIGDKEALRDFATIEQQLITLASFAPITILGGAVSTAQYASAQKNFQNATLALKDILKDNGYKTSQAEYIMDLIMDTTPSQMAKQVAPIINQMALETEGDAGNLLTGISEFIRTKSVMQGYDGIYEAEHQEKRNELDQDMQNEIGEYTNKKGEVEMAVDKDGNANYVLSDVADELEPLIVIKGLDGQTKMVSKSEYEANYTPSVLTSKDEYLSEMIMTKQTQELAEETKIEEDANFLNSIELGVPQYFNINGVMTEGTPQAITPDGSITVHFGNHVEMLTADQYKALNQPTAVTAAQTEELAQAEQEQAEIQEQEELAQEEAQPVQEEAAQEQAKQLADIERRKQEEILNRKGKTISQSEVEGRFIKKRNSDKTHEKLTEGLNHTNGNINPEKRWIDKDDAIFQELVDLGVKPDSRGVIDNTVINKAFSENESRLKKEVNEDIKQEGLKRVTDEFRKQDDKQKFEEINAKYDAEIDELLNKQKVTPEQVAQEQTAEAQETPRELPKTADGETDFDALLDADPETYAQELAKAIGDERAANTMSALAKQTDAQIEKLQKRLEKETSTNKIVSINRNIDQLQQRRDALTGLIVKGSKPQTPQTPEVTDGQTARPVQAGQVGQNIADKWNNAPKQQGIEETFTLPNGKQIKGRWILTEAWAPTPSHDPHTLQPSEGFPVTKDGRNVNDNDYTKKAAEVETMAQSYDTRAIDHPIFVKNGVVVSGNNSTMSGILAAERGTDTKYREGLAEKAKKMGFTLEQIAQFKNPRLYVEISEDIPLNTETFALFNQRVTKGKTPTELAIVASKRDNTHVVGLISRELDGYERLSDLYQNEGASTAIAKYLTEGGLINQNELPELFENGSFTPAGKDFLESVLVGSVMKEDQVKILATEGMKSTRQRVVKAIVPLIENSKLREEGRIIDDINTGIKYLYGAKKAGMTLREYFLQSNMFEAATYDLNGVRNALMLQGTEKDFRDYVQLANKRLKDPIANMFTGEMETKDDVYQELENQYNDEQRRTIEAARAANAQSGAANDQRAVLPGGPKDNEPGGPGISADAGEQTEASPATNEGSGSEVDTQPTHSEQKEDPGQEQSDQGLVSVFGAAEQARSTQEQKEKNGAKEGTSLEDLSTKDIEARVAEYDKIINEREASIKRSNTPLTGSNSGVGTLTENEFNEFTNLTGELQRRNTISAKEAKERVAEKRAERLAAMKQDEKKEEPGIVSVFKAAQEQKEKNEAKNRQDGKGIIPQKISKPKMPKTKEEYCRTLANIVSNDSKRPVMTGVLFDADNKMIVASDAFMLVAIPSSLPKTTEIIGASKRKSSGVEFGQLLKGQYPNYKAVIPLSPSERFEGRFNIELLLGQALTILKEANERIKQLDKPNDQEKAHERILKFGIHNVNAKQLSDVLRALYDTGTKHVVVEYTRRDRPLVFRDERDMNKVGLVMPVYIPEEGEDGFEERFRNIPVLVNRNTIAINKEPGSKKEKNESEKEDSAMNPDNSPVAEEEEKADKQAQTEKIDNIFASLSDLTPHNEQLWANTSISRWKANKILNDIREFQDAAVENGTIEYEEQLDRHYYEIVDGKEIKINIYKLNGYTIELGYDGDLGTHGASGLYTQVENPQGEILKIYVPKYRTEKTIDISYRHPRFIEKLAKDVTESTKQSPKRFEQGSKLNEKEKSDVLKTMKDSYKEMNRERSLEAGLDGNERFVWKGNAEDYMVVSDITGRKVRWYVTMPDGKIAHPTELYPNMTNEDIKSAESSDNYHLQQSEVNYRNGAKKLTESKKSVIDQLQKALDAGLEFVKTYDSSDVRERNPVTMIRTNVRTKENPNGMIIPLQEYMANNNIDIPDLNNFDWERYYNDNARQGEQNTHEAIEGADVIDPSIKPKKGDKIAFEIGGREVKFEYDSFISDKNGTLTYDYFGIKMLKPGEYRIERGGNVINVKQGNRSNTKLASTEEREESEKIEDFGEKIEGAKKDIWQKNEATSEDIKSLPLSKIFPRPDFPQLVKDGKLPVESALLLRYLYDTIPPRPRKEYKLRTWVSGVKGVIDAMNTLIDNPSHHEQIMSKMGLLLPSYHNSITTYIALHKELGFPETDLNTGKYEVKRFDGRGYSILHGPYIISDHETLAEAAAALKRRIEQTRKKLSNGDVKLSIYQDTRTKKYFIGRKGATGTVRLVDNIEKLADAKTMFRDQQVQLQEMWRQLKVKPEERRSSNRERIGVDYRKGKNVTPETFSETFGFRGVQFGNWVNNDERQGSLNEAFDALMDLSTTLGISGRALSLNGELGIAFGARGSGKYNAHYEPGQVVINLTKTKGAGSLAHEWWHALDNYFSRMKGDKSKYFTESPRQKILNTGEKDQSVRKEMADSFKALVSAINKSGLPERSRNLDKARSAPYWSTIIEMSARSFENYIIEKLAASEGSNDYLANFKEIGEWAERGLNENNYPYPTKDETDAINPAFQDLFDTIQEKVDQDTGNVMLYRTAEEQSFSTYTELDQIKQKAIADGSFMKAPNGKQTNLNERQWLQVRTKAFKEWFGDWESDPKNASKVVDENGEPLVVYHGTNAEFNEFRGNHGQIMFSPSRKYAQIMAGDGKVMEAYLKVERPFEEMDLDFFEWARDYEEYVEELKTRGYDGAISADDGEQISVFNPSQIKSATDNVGTFDAGNEDIRFRMAQKAEAATDSMEEESLYKDRNRTIFTDNNVNNKGRNSILQEDAVQMQLSWDEQVGDVPAQRAAAIAADPDIAKIQQSAGYNPVIDHGFTAVERVLSNNGAVTFMGNPLTGPAKINGPGAVAFLFKNLESASSENAFIALIDKKNNYRVLYLSTGNEYSTIIDFKSIPAAIKEFDAAKICMVHNHPSGSLTPSDNDIKCQTRIGQIAREMGIEAMPGIIINLDTGKYAEFTQHFINHPDMLRKEAMGDVSPVDIYAFDRQILYMPSSQRIQLNEPSKVAQFISQQKRGINGKVHVMILDRALMVSRYFLMDGNLSTSEMLNTIWPAVGKHGIYVMLASNDQFNNVQLSDLKDGLKLIDSQLLDVLTIKQDKGIITNYESLSNQGLLDEQVRYEKQQTMLNDMVAAKKFMNDKGSITYTELTEEEIPENTQVAYKLMRYFNNKPGVLYPLYAKDEAGKKGFKKGVWYKAERQSVKIGGKNLAERPGIHAVDLPLFLQGKVRKSGETRVWAKVLMPAMSEKTQTESDNTTLLPNGQRSGIRERVIGPKEAYNFKTNPNATGSGVWPIAGSMKVERVLSDAEVGKILVDNGKEDYVTLSMSGDPEIRYRLIGEEALEQSNQEFPTTINIDGIERSTTNSEGKPIAQTEEGVRNFWRWFGDSKVVDNEGKPLVVYHGTNKEFNSFNEGTQYFAVNENEASGYANERSDGLDKGAPNIISAYLKIVNPAKDDDITVAAEQAGVDPDSDIASALANIKEVKTILERSGFDGIGPVLDLGFKSDFDEFETYATFNANQIKSATNNTGAFDPNNNDIRFRTVNDTGFYSTVEDALERLPQEKGTPEQMKAMLLKNGAKEAEMDWMGYDQQFKGKSVTKQEIQDWIGQNKIEVEEKINREEQGTPIIKKLNDRGIGVAQDPSKDVFYWISNGFELSAEEKFKNTDLISELASIRMPAPKYSQYTVPGGKNYQELLLTMPIRKILPEGYTLDKLGDSYKVFDKNGNVVSTGSNAEIATENALRSSSIKFQSGHFNEPNILAHVRFNEREVNGERVLFIEEIQSDWAQQGKKKGFKGDDSEYDSVFAELIKIRDEKLAYIKEVDPYDEYTISYLKAEYPRMKELNEKENQLIDREYELRRKKEGVPDMPFKQTGQWVNLALRRMMRYAAENGFDRIAWTNGEQQAERYDLSKQVDKINWTKKGDTYDISPTKDGSHIGFPVGVKTTNLTKNEVADLVGKEIADKIEAETGKNYETGQLKQGSLSGLDLKVGGEGMKAFYDNIVPKAANKLGKPFGAKIEEVQLPLVAKDAYDEYTGEPRLSEQGWEIHDRFMESQAEEGDYALEDYVKDMKDAGYEVLFENGEPSNLKKITSGQTFTVQSLPVTYAMKESASGGMPLFRPFMKSPMRERIIARDRLESVADKLNIKVNIVNRADIKNEKQKRAKGFFEPRTGNITIVLDNHKTADDAIATLLHEAVAHKGLRNLFGADFDRFLDNVYQSAGKEVRAEINKLIAKNGWDTRLATEEYLATLAESTDYDQNESLWRKIKNYFMDMLRRAGIKMDGILTDADLRYILQRSYDRLTDPSGPGGVFDAARDSQIRRRVGLNSDNDTRNRSNKNAAQDKAEQFANNAYDARLNETINKVREAHQDSMLSLKILQEEVAKASDKEIQTFEDAYLAENHISSKNLYEKEHFMANYYEPMSKAIRSLADKLDGEYQSVVTYAMAKHGLERNIKLAERDAEKMHAKWKAELDKKLAQELIDQAKYDKEIKRLDAKYDETVADFRGRDYSGLTALFPASESVEGLPDVALAEAMAQELVDQVEEAAPEEVQELWSRVNAATKKSLYKTYETGILTRSVYENIRDMYDHYIPLRGFSETTADDVYEYLQFDRSSFSPPVLTARGRKSMADDPFATIGTMAESAIQQGNNNWMKQKFLNMALNHESDLISVREMWYENKGTEENPDWVQAMPDIAPGANAMEVNQAYETFEQRMADLVGIGMARKTMKGLNIPYRTLGKQAQEHSVIVKSAGKEYVIFINGNPRAAQAINGLTNPDVSDTRKKIMRANRWLAANYTTRSPKFMLRNLSRDTIYSLFNIYVKEDKAYNRRFRANLARSYVSIWKLMRDYSQNKLDVTNQEGMYMQEFLANGGETGYTVLKRVDEYKRIMSDLMLQAKGGKVVTLKKALRYMFDQIGFANRCVEDICRFTAFTTSRQMGRSVEESIADAKNVSVNFNKKGSGQGYGASTLRTAYLFYNAGIQGLDNFVNISKKNPKKFTIGTASMLAAGALIPFFNQLIAMALGGDPEEYLDMPEWIRRNNMVLGGNGFYITIPLPIELRAIYGIGDIAYMASAGRMKNKNIAGEILGQLTDVMPVDPVGNNAGVANLVPDIVAPLFENLINEDFTGRPIFKNNSFNRYYPAFTKAYAGTNKALVRASELINRIGGGDDVTKGWVENNITIADVNNPAKWEHIFEGYFGGALTTANEAAKTLSMIWDPDQRILRNVPLANVLLQHNDERTSNSFINDMYYYYKEEYDKVKQSVIKYGQDPEKYSKQQRSLEDKDRYKRYLVFEEYLDEVKSVEKELKEAPDDETKRDLNAYYNRLKGRLVDELMKRD